jgi:PAS domain S-box-containing protein
VIVVDDDDRVVDSNPGASTLFGREPERLHGRRVARFFSDPDQAMEALRDARSGKVGPGIEVAVHTPYPGACTAIVTGMLIRGERDSAPATILVFRDVSALRHAERAWQRSEQFFRAVFHEGAVAMAVLDLSGRFVQINDALCELMGRPRAVLIRQRLPDVALPGDQEPIASDLRTLIRYPDRTARRELRLEGSDSKERWANVTLKRVEDPTLGRSRVLCVLHDITEAKRVEALRRELVESVVAAQEDERQRVSRELHDGVGQVLSSLSVRLVSLGAQLEEGPAKESLHELVALAQAATAETRQMARRLRPPALDELGFVVAMQNMMADHQRSHAVSVDFHARGMGGIRLSPAIETALYRIAQEALANSARHAKATNVQVVVDRTPDNVRLIVEDDGLGFDSEESAAGLGLKNIRERAALLSGVATIESSPGIGTSVFVDLPMSVS